MRSLSRDAHPTNQSFGFVLRAVCCPVDMVWMVDSDLSPSPEEVMECHITGGFR